MRTPVVELTIEHAHSLSEAPRQTLNELLFPGPTAEYAEAIAKYGDVSALPTSAYLYGLHQDFEHEVSIEEGKTLLLGLASVSDPDDRGFRTVMATINGQLRPVAVRDQSLAGEASVQAKADPNEPGQVAAPYGGSVTPYVAVGDEVAIGDTVATIEAMKMEASIASPIRGVVEHIALLGTKQVDGGDLILRIGPRSKFD